MDERRRDDLSALGALAEPSRRALYDYVVSRRAWVSREEAADATGLQRGIAAHHLDRLADDGLLEVSYERRTGRRGPGAGRPAKVYRRAATELDVTLPARRYEMAGRVLADAADAALRDGTPIADAVDAAAHDEGRRIGAAVAAGLGRRRGVAARRARLLEELAELGFEPEIVEDDLILLHNCPFHRLAVEHTALICGMNVSVLDGLLEALGDTGLRAVLEPAEGSCCVRFRAEAGADQGVDRDR